MAPGGYIVTVLCGCDTHLAASVFQVASFTGALDANQLLAASETCASAAEARSEHCGQRKAQTKHARDERPRRAPEEAGELCLQCCKYYAYARRDVLSAAKYHARHSQEATPRRAD